MLTAVARYLMPQGAVQQVGSLVCGMLLLWAVLKPLPFLTTARLWNVDLDSRTKIAEEDLQQRSEQLLKSIIEQECEAYILDKAAELGVECTVHVDCELSETGTWIPDRVRIEGALSALQRRELGQIISEDLGVDSDRQEVTGGGG